MAALTVQAPVSNSGATLTANAVSSSDTFVNDGATYLIVRNRHASTATTVGIAPASSSAVVAGRGYLTAPTVSTSVAAGADAIFGPFAPDLYNTSGAVTVTFSSTSSVTATPVSMTRL